jgi:hypothetical protein
VYKRIEKCLRSGDESSHDTDILFDYGIFTPGCRRADLADMRRLQMNIGSRTPHLSDDRLFPDPVALNIALRSRTGRLWLRTP